MNSKKSPTFWASISLAIVLLVLGAWSAIAWAQDAPVQPNTQQWWQAALTLLLGALGTFLTIVLTMALSKITKLIEAKYHVEIPAAEEQAAKDKLLSLVSSAEETAEKRILHGDGVKTPGAEKADSVIKSFMTWAAAQGFSKTWVESEARQMMEGELHLNRVDNEGVGSIGDRKEVLDTLAKPSTVQVTVAPAAAAAPADAGAV